MNHTWSADFISDAPWAGSRLPSFNINDDLDSGSMKIEIDASLPSARIIRALDELIELRGADLPPLSRTS
ncbi:hypothetical protein IPQ81_08600 [Xanthomonas perforans]|nr:hypothetical protein [Xanthomonas perforans]MBZ3527993.1 hypothetical protein [Xanthomonas perforans]